MSTPKSVSLWAVSQTGQFSPVAYIEATQFVIDSERNILTFLDQGQAVAVFHLWSHIEKVEAMEETGKPPRHLRSVSTAPKADP